MATSFSITNSLKRGQTRIDDMVQDDQTYDIANALYNTARVMCRSNVDCPHGDDKHVAVATNQTLLAFVLTVMLEQTISEGLDREEVPQEIRDAYHDSLCDQVVAFLMTAVHEHEPLRQHFVRHFEKGHFEKGAKPNGATKNESDNPQCGNHSGENLAGASPAHD